MDMDVTTTQVLQLIESIELKQVLDLSAYTTTERCYFKDPFLEVKLKNGIIFQEIVVTLVKRGSVGYYTTFYFEKITPTVSQMYSQQFEYPRSQLDIFAKVQTILEHIQAHYQELI